MISALRFSSDRRHLPPPCIVSCPAASHSTTVRGRTKRLRSTGDRRSARLVRTGMAAMPALANERVAYHNGGLSAREPRAAAVPRPRLPLWRRRVRHDPHLRTPHLPPGRPTSTASTASLRYRADRSRTVTAGDVRRHRGGAGPQSAICSARRRLLGLAADQPRDRLGRPRGPGVQDGADGPGRMHAAALARAGGPLPRRHRVVVPAHRRTPPEALSPQAKTNNYLNMIVADQEVGAIDPGAWAVLLDMAGQPRRGPRQQPVPGQRRRLLTPPARHLLPGISRQTVIEIAGELGIPCRETDLESVRCLCRG